MSTCTTTLVFSTNNVFWFDIALCSANSNIIYGLGNNNDLYWVNVTTSQWMSMSNQFNTLYPGNHSLTSMVCDGNGTLYVADGNSPGLYSYTVATSSWAYHGALSGYESAGDLAFYNGALYLSTLTDELIAIDPVTFNVLSVTPMNATGVFGVGVVSTATLCNAGSMSMIAASGDSLYSLDPVTGICTMLCPTIIPTISSIGVGGIASVFEGTNPPQSTLQVYTAVTSICLGSSATLSATGADFYLWQPGNLPGPSITVQPSVTTTYSVIGTDSAGCSDTIPITIVVNPPLVATTSLQMVSCFGACDGSATVNVSGNGPFVYLWTPYVPPTATLSSLCPGPRSCIITGAGGCRDTVAFVITQPSVLSVVPSQTNALCNGGNSGSATMTVSGGSPAYSYAWSSGGTGATETNLGAGTYTCTVTDANGCSISQTFSITQPVALTSSVSSSPQCGIDNGSASVSVSGGTPGYTYAWSPSGGNSPQATGLTSGNYTCTVTDANGCVQTQTVPVVANPLPVIGISSDTTIMAGASVTLTSTGGGDYLWSPSAGLSCTTCPSTVANPVQTTAYCVQVTDTNGCVDSACVVVTVDSDCGDIFIPNAFSPNNDSQNDLLCVRGGQCILFMQFEVYDRWGEKVFASSDPSVCWDGMFRGQPANIAVYVYSLNATLVNGQQVHKQGNVSLVR